MGTNAVCTEETFKIRPSESLHSLWLSGVSQRDSLLVVRSSVVKRTNRGTLRQRLPLNPSQINRLLGLLMRSRHVFVLEYAPETPPTPEAEWTLKLRGVDTLTYNETYRCIVDRLITNYSERETMPSRSARTSFTRSVESSAVVDPGLESKLLPHQLRNLAICRAKEVNRISSVKMLSHYTMGPFVGLLSQQLGFLATRPLLDRVMSVIHDEVGSGKTRSALAVVYAGLHPEAVTFTQTFDQLPWRIQTTSTSHHARRPHHLSQMPKFSCPLTIDNIPIEAATAPRAGTLIVIQHNMVNHWADEIDALWMPRTRPRVGIVGKGELAKGASISPQALADSYDIVLVPNTLLRTSCLSKFTYVNAWTTDFPDLNSPFHAGKQFVWHGTVVEAGRRGTAARCTVVATREFMQANVNLEARELLVTNHALQGPDNHVRVLDGLLDLDSIPLHACWVRGNAEQGVTRIRLDELLVLRPNYDGHGQVAVDGDIYARMLGFDCGAVSPLDTVPALEALMHVRWSRLVVDEIHLYKNNTQKRKFVEALWYDSLLGLTAQRDLNARINIFEKGLQVLGLNCTGETSYYNNLIHEANSITNASYHQIVPRVSDPILVDMPADVVELCTGIMSNVRRIFIERGYGNALQPWMFGMVAVQVSNVLKHILRNLSFDRAPHSVDTYMASIMTYVTQRESTHHATHASSFAATNLDTNMYIPASSFAAHTEVSCPICFEDIAIECLAASVREWVASVPCNHAMCLDCYQEAINTHNTQLLRKCVMCRSKVTSFGYIGSANEEPTPATTAPEIVATPALATAPEIVPTPAPATAQSPTVDGGKTSMLLALLLYLTLAPESDGRQPATGIVVFCEGSDAQMEDLRKRIQDSVPYCQCLALLSSHTKNARQRILSTVQSSEAHTCHILLVRYRMCAVGLNFVFANHCILYNMPHRSDYLHQAVGRLCRIGQRSDSVTVWPVLYRGDRCFEQIVWNEWKTAIGDTRTLRTLSDLAARCMCEMG